MGGIKEGTIGTEMDVGASTSVVPVGHDGLYLSQTSLTIFENGDTIGQLTNDIEKTAV